MIHRQSPGPPRRRVPDADQGFVTAGFVAGPRDPACRLEGETCRRRWPNHAARGLRRVRMEPQADRVGPGPSAAGPGPFIAGPCGGASALSSRGPPATPSTPSDRPGGWPHDDERPRPAGMSSTPKDPRPSTDDRREGEPPGRVTGSAIRPGGLPKPSAFPLSPRPGFGRGRERWAGRPAVTGFSLAAITRIVARLAQRRTPPSRR